MYTQAGTRNHMLLRGPDEITIIAVNNRGVPGSGPAEHVVNNEHARAGAMALFASDSALEDLLRDAGVLQNRVHFAAFRRLFVDIAYVFVGATHPRWKAAPVR